MNENHYCPNCGAKVDPSDTYCPHCGSPLSSTPDHQSNHTYTGTYEPNNNPSHRSSSQGIDYDTLTLVMGILSIFFFGILFGVLGLIFANKANQNDTKTKAGKVLSIIGIVLWALAIPLAFFF